MNWLDAPPTPTWRIEPSAATLTELASPTEVVATASQPEASPAADPTTSGSSPTPATNSSQQGQRAGRSRTTASGAQTRRSAVGRKTSRGKLASASPTIVAGPARPSATQVILTAIWWIGFAVAVVLGVLLAIAYSAPFR
jgi:hypothetical protein